MATARTDVEAQEFKEISDEFFREGVNGRLRIHSQKEVDKLLKARELDTRGNFRK